MVAYIPNPEAENVDNQPLGYKYWTQMVHGKSPEWIKSYVLGEYATVYDGKPIAKPGRMAYVDVGGPGSVIIELMKMPDKE